MPFSFSEAINNFSEKLLGSPFVVKVSSHPIYSAIAITLIIVFVILVVFRDVEELSTLSTSAGIYIFFAVMGCIFLHDKILMREMYAKNRNTNIDDVFTAAAAPRVDDDVVPVPITYDLNSI